MGLFYNAQFLCFAHSKTPRFGHGVINTTCNFCVSHTAKKTHVFGMGSSLQRTISVFRAQQKTHALGMGLSIQRVISVFRAQQKPHAFGMGSSLQRVISVFRAQQKPHALGMGSWLYLMPGSVLLSHGETPHYHRRYGVSLLSSAWDQVGPPRYGRQANSVSINPQTSNTCQPVNTISERR
uniref:Uncharacterized protein n=1 Tax=Yersinia pseudotuberculosis serotype O:3 (strain YPIII) TaxID=502800 RepID=A0A0H3B764_YERPY